MVDLPVIPMVKEGFCTGDCDTSDERALATMSLQCKQITKGRWDSVQLKHWEDICSEYSTHVPKNTPTDESSTGLIDEIDRGLQDETLCVFSPHSEPVDWNRLLEELEKMEKECQM
jgi:hypothetical protein